MLKCGILGEKLGHSYSPVIHNMFGDYEYKLYECDRKDLPAFLGRGDFDGLTVAMPYKRLAVPYCAELSDIARETGCVNTILRRADGTLYGDNTDVFGFENLLDHGDVAVEGKKALVLGSGGASATAVTVLRRRGAREVVVVSREGVDNYQNLPKHFDAELIVNTTPVGMYPRNDKSPVNLQFFPKLSGVIDVVYNPARTMLIMQAERLGIPHAGGMRMLVAQAKLASELFTGRKLDDSEIDRVEHEASRKMENVVLIGMPGCGKTTLARELGKALGRHNVSSDVLVEDITGMTIPEIFSQQGESGFRKLENEALTILCKRSGRIIATGGGCITREENYPLLHQNGTIFWVKRDIDVLPTAGRPLSQQRGVQKLYEERKPLYEQFADIVVDNNGSVEEAVEQIVEAFK